MQLAFNERLQKIKKTKRILQKTIESIDSSNDSWNILKIFGQITFRHMTSLHPWPYCKEKRKEKQRKKKRKTKKRKGLVNSVLEKLKSYFYHGLLSFCVTAMASVHSVREIYWLLLLKITVISCKTYFSAIYESKLKYCVRYCNFS